MITATVNRWNGVAFVPLDLEDYGVAQVVRSNVSMPKVTPVTVAPLRSISEKYVRTDVANGELDFILVIRDDVAHYPNARRLQALLQYFTVVFSDDPGYTYTLTQTEASKQPISSHTAILTVHCTFEVNSPVTVAKTWSNVLRITEYVNIDSGKETNLSFLITTGASVSGDLTVNGVYIKSPPASTTFEIGLDALLAGNEAGAVYNAIPTGVGSTLIDIFGSAGISFCDSIVLRYTPRW